MLQKQEVYILIIVATLVCLLVGLFLVIFVMYFIKKKKQVLLEKEILERDFKETLIQSQLEIQEQTMRHISRELHDNLGQVASLIKINLNTIRWEDQAKAIDKVTDTKELVRQMITDIKSLSVSLGADRISQTGLARALQTESDRIAKTNLFTSSFEVDGIFPSIDPDKAVILYRMAQEILNNAVKHSNAAQININGTVTETLFTLVFTDDGVGFNMDEKTNSESAGLRNLQNRARLINAQLQSTSSPGNGTKVTIALPL